MGRGICLAPVDPARMYGLQPEGVDTELFQIAEVEPRTTSCRSHIGHFGKGSALVRCRPSGSDRQRIGLVKLKILRFCRRYDDRVIAFENSLRILFAVIPVVGAWRIGGQPIARSETVGAGFRYRQGEGGPAGNTAHWISPVILANDSRGAAITLRRLGPFRHPL